MFTRHHWANDLHQAGYWPRWVKSPNELNGYVFKTKASHLDGGHRLWSGMEGDGLRHATLSKTHHMKMTTTTQSIPARSSPGTRTAPSVLAIGTEAKSMTNGPKSLCARNNHTIGTWNMRSLRAAGKVEELTHEMMRYQWNILGLGTSHKLRGNVYTRRPEMLLQLQWRETGAWSWIPHLQRHCGCHSRDADQSLANSLPFVRRQYHLTSPSSKLVPQQLTMMTMMLKTSTINCKKSYTRRQRKTSL